MEKISRDTKPISPLNLGHVTPFYSQRGGLRTGLNFWLTFDFVFPLARICLYEDKLVITYPFGGKIILKIEEVERISIIDRYVLKGFMIVHHGSPDHSYLLFWSFRHRQLEAHFREYCFWKENEPPKLS